MYDCYFTNVLTQRSCLGFLLTADSQCFTLNDARTFVPTIPRRRLWPGERSLWVETSRSSFIAEVWSFSPQAPLSLVSSPSKYPPSFVALAFNKTKPALSSIAVVTKAIKRTARTSLSHLGTSTTLFPAIWTKTARSIEELFSQWKRPRRASSDQRTDEEDTSETCNNNQVGGRALTNAQKRNWGGTYIYVLGHRDGRFGDVYIRPVAVNGLIFPAWNNPYVNLFILSSTFLVGSFETRSKGFFLLLISQAGHESRLISHLGWFAVKAVWLVAKGGFPQ